MNIRLGIKFMEQQKRISVVRCLILGAVCLLGFGIGAGGMLLLPPPALPEEQAATSGLTNLVAANPRLTPEDVVRLQLTALRSSRRDETAIEQCFALASPTNRAVTGPCSRFSQMVRRQPYGALVDGERALIGTAVVRGPRAMVLVTVFDEQKNVCVYRFLLSRQEAPPYAGCWMTDAVRADGVLEGDGGTAPEMDDSARLPAWPRGARIAYQTP